MNERLGEVELSIPFKALENMDDEVSFVYDPRPHIFIKHPTSYEGFCWKCGDHPASNCHYQTYAKVELNG